MRIVHTPPLPRAAEANRAFLQRIELLDDRAPAGRAAWHLPDGDEGVVQLIELSIDPNRRRRGHAGTLLNESIAQARALCKLRRIALRRIWLAVEQERQVIARSFLTCHGFHHTATIADLLRDADLLVYVRSFD